MSGGAERQSTPKDMNEQFLGCFSSAASLGFSTLQSGSPGIPAGSVVLFSRVLAIETSFFLICGDLKSKDCPCRLRWTLKTAGLYNIEENCLPQGNLQGPC